MSLQQKKVIDSIDVLLNGVIQVRQKTGIYDDAEPETTIVSNYHRWTLEPAQDITDQDPKVIAIATAVWTPEVIASYQENMKLKTGAIE